MATSLTDIVDPTHSALVIIEAQNGVIGPDTALPALKDACVATGMIDNMIRVANTARKSGVKVIQATAENLPGNFGVNQNARLFAGTRKAGGHLAVGSTSVNPLDEIWDPSDLVLPRYCGLNPMVGTALDYLLRNEGITTIVCAGVSLNIAITNMVFDSINRGYQAVVITDAVAATPVEYGPMVLQNTLAYLATLATADQIIETWSAATSS
jgi:nicotinamidase-related amidase